MVGEKYLKSSFLEYKILKMLGNLRKRNDAWKSDDQMKESLTDYVRKRWQLADILHYMERDFSDDYTWSMGTLKRRLKFFGLKMIVSTKVLL